ncbi:MAG: hypothetical protein IJ735_01745 [Clostridia bacterium]|nr:hypothetical protein [Clostridia bacterium]
MRAIRSIFGVCLGVLIMLVLAFSTTVATAAYADDVRYLASAQDLLDLALRYENSEELSGQVYELTADIDMSEVEEFLPIGSSVNAFNGTFDGKGHSVTLDMRYRGEATGLFGEISPVGLVKNLIVKGSVVADNGTCGSVAGINNGAISDCVNYASVTGSGTNVGGIVGQNGGSISGCVSLGETVGASFLGGIAGVSRGGSASVVGCVGFGTVRTEVANASSIGGLIGECASALSDSYFYGTVTATGDRIGLAVGYLTSSAGKNVYAVGNRNVVGLSSVNLPTTYLKTTAFGLLAGKVNFSEGTLTYLRYQEGFGYLPLPTSLPNGCEEDFLHPLYSGEGTAEDPYLIGSAEDFELFSTNSKLYSYENKFFRLNAPVTAVKGQYIGTATRFFSGTFDGYGNAITVELSSGSPYLGLFAGISGSGSVADLTVSGSVSGTDYVGALAGACDGTVKNVSATGTVSGQNYVGGLFGSLSSVVTDCSSSCTVEGLRYVGGIAGKATDDTVSELVSDGVVQMASGSSYAYFGGIFGSATRVEASGLLFKGSLTSYKADRSGGLFGSAEETEARSSAVIGTLSGRNHVGGLVGESQIFSATDCFVFGGVNGASSVGGLVGSGTPAISTSYFSGRLGEVREAQVDRASFRTIAPVGATLDRVYYNSDELYSGTDGIGKSAVEFSRGDLLTGAAWTVLSFTTEGGYFPFVDPANGVSEDTVVMQKLSYSYFADGNGSEATPYLLAREIHFRNFSYLSGLDTAYLDKHYLQTADVTFERSLSPISGSFGGTFDGGLHRLDGLRVTSGAGALFAEIGTDATVKRLFIGQGTVLSASVAVLNRGNVSECFSLATVSGGTDLGGLVVQNKGTIQDCLFAGKVSSSASGFLGGIAAINEGTIESCVSSGYLEGKGYLGGLVGKNASVLNRSVVSGTLHKRGESAYAGGFAGTNAGGSIDNSAFIGVVYIDGERFDGTGDGVGAIIGKHNAEDPSTINIRVYFDSDFAPFASLFGNTPQSVSGRSHTGEYIVNNVVSNFEDYESVALADGESDFAPLPAYFATVDEGLTELVQEAARIQYFGWDGLSDEQCGSERNPYLVSTQAQLKIIAEKVSDGFDYRGDFFRMVCDIEVTTADFRPIGRYVSSGSGDNAVFNGTFDGAGFVLDGFAINEQADYGYVGLFAYTGADFFLKDLTIGTHSSITTAGQYAGSFVGNNSGKIVGCVSYATLSATGFIGGIAAVTAAGTEILDCAFCGTMDESKPNAYGITSQNADRTPRFVTTDSWYVRDKDEFVEGNNESYVHNDYGSVLFVDRGGDVEVSRTADGLRFVLLPEVGALGRILNVKDGALYTEEGAGYYTATDENVTSGKSVKYYARFTHLTRATWDGDSDLIADDYGSGYFYYGQRVTFSFDVKYGYFLDDADYSAIEGEWKTATDTVDFVFTKPSGAFDLVLHIKDFSDYGALNVGTDLTYDATDKDIRVDYEAATADKFNREAGLSGIYFYTIPSMARSASVNAAGSYRVVAKIYLAGQTRFCGTLSADLTIEKAILTADESDMSYWTAFAGKVYDGAASSVATVNNAYVNNVAPADFSLLTVRATVTLDSATAGDRVAQISDFVLSGPAATNYSFPAATVSDVPCVVSRRPVTYTIADNNLSGRFTGSLPAIVGTPSVSMGTASISFGFEKLTEEGDTDEEWAALPVGNKTWHVGSYALSVFCSDVTDYDLVLAEEYVYTILPYEIVDLTYSGYENLVYDATDKGVLGYYETVNGARERVNFTFLLRSDKGEVVREGKTYEIRLIVRDAGEYVAVPAIENTDYVLSDSVEPLLFRVEKNCSAGEIEFEFDGATRVEIGGRIPLTVSSELYDATLVVVPYGATRGRATLEETEPGKYDFVPTAYSTTEQFTFRLAAIGSKNYEDRYSGVRSVGLIAGKIYVGLSEASETLVYGEIPDLIPVFSYREDLSEPIERPEEIAGFVAPTITVDADDLHVRQEPYAVSFVGGDSDGYKIVPVRSRIYFTVLPRPVRVGIFEEHNNGKVYGETDQEIEYTLFDGSAGNNTRLTVLPDGREVTLSGTAAREPGEAVGRYRMDLGTLPESNPDFEIHENITTQYVIDRRSLELVVDEVRKTFGEQDPAITFSPTGGTSYAHESDAEQITLRVERASGEDVGSYAYTVVAYSGNENYTVDRVDARTHAFHIDRATPSVNYNILGEITYGDELRTLVISGDAYGNGTKVQGIFSWLIPDKRMTVVGGTVEQLLFTPTSDNYNSVIAPVEITVGKRVADVLFGGSLVYTYNGREQCSVTARVVNGAFEEVELVSSVDRDPVGVGDYVYSVEPADKTHYVIADGKNSITFSIKPATLTVRVKDDVVEAGEKYVPTIEYDGFVNGENANVLTRKPTVANLPTSGGNYVVTASGAAGQNYDFVYVPGSIRIGRESATSSMATIAGNLPAELSIKSKAISGAGLTVKEDELNIAQGKNLFLPNFLTLTDYVSIEGNIEIEGELTYTVRVKLSSASKIYLVMADGSVVPLEDYEVVESDIKTAEKGEDEESGDGRTEITFDSEEIRGVAVYESRDIKGILTVLLPDILIAVGLIVVVLIVVVICVVISKRDKKKEAYRRYLDGE